MKWMEKNSKDCRKATFLVEKKMHSTLKFSESIKLQLHLYGCSWCKSYQRQSQQIELMIGNVFKQSAKRPKKLDEKFKKELQLLINTNLNYKQ